MESNQQRPDSRETAGQWQLRDLKGPVLAAIQVGAVLVFGVAFVVGVALRGLLRGTPGMSVSVDSITPVLILLGSIVGILVLHEAIHAVLFMLYGGKVRFGVKLIGRFLPVAYATSTVQMPRNRYLVVCLGPFVLLTAILLPIGVLAQSDITATFALLLMALNAGGSVGDLVQARVLLRYDRGTLFQDTEDGFNWRRLGERVTGDE
jgi:hypothetical protein